MLPPAMMRVTARMIIAMPQPILGVSGSPKTATPKTTAVTGSPEPSLACGVEPIYPSALLVHTPEKAVGKIARASRFPHKYHWSGTVMCSPKSRRTKNSVSPDSRM